MELIKFRIYDPTEKRMVESGATPTMLASFFRATAVLNVRDGMEYQQFTGLLDKTGKEIWEGDILKHPIYHKALPVKWYDGEYIAGFYATSKLGHQLTNIALTVCEIIGTVDENSELLEDET